MREIIDFSHLLTPLAVVIKHNPTTQVTGTHVYLFGVRIAYWTTRMLVKS